MISKKHYKLGFMFLFIFAFFLVITGFITLYQQTKINNDGSGIINLQYFINDSVIANNKLIGNFPFTESMIREYFTSPNTDIKNIKLDYDKNAFMTYITVNIDFKDLSKLNLAKGFSSINASWTKSDSGMMFKYILLKDILNEKVLDKLTYKFTFDGDVISTNGSVENSNIATFVKKRG